MKSTAQYKAERIEGLLRFNRYSPVEEASMRKDLEALRSEVQLEELTAAWNRASDEAKIEFLRREGSPSVSWRISE